VKAIEFIKEVSIATKRMTVKATNMVKVEKMNKGKKEEPALISAMYLEYIGDIRTPKTPVAEQVCKVQGEVFKLDKMALEGRWFFGRCSPLECTIWLCNRFYLSAGSFL
ncbi:hypothetical protein PMAYCL1PPCAC_12842, partial [Pristionchus mayeri]